MINPKGLEEVGVFQSNLTIFDSCELKKNALSSGKVKRHWKVVNKY